MKAKLLLVGTVILPIVAGCTYANSEQEPAEPAAVVTEPVQAVAPAETATNANVADAVVPVGQVVNTNFVAPETVRLSPAATEIAKMARSGVDSSVMLTYVQNSVNTYNLAADEIVYLNDIGVHPDVVSAMIQHDQQIREASISGAVAASPATPAPGGSVWSQNDAAPSSNVWQETAAAPAPETDVQTTVPPPPEEERPTEVTVNYFYNSLAPYGTWIDIDGYGRCWRPTVAVTYSGWRPYVHGGRWLWTDSGWYWYSDYSWGWAPFHYGRWFAHPTWGWCWVPGTVWGPSWVSWRYTDGYCGWAPLPPAAYYSPRVGFSYYGRSCGVGFSFGLTWDCFTFVSYRNFCGRYYDRHRIGRHETARIYNNSTVINNVIVGDNNTIINQGISPDRITSVTRSEVPQARIERVSSDSDALRGRHEVLAANGGAVTVARHEVPGGRPHRGDAGRVTTGSSENAGVATTPLTKMPSGSPSRAEVTRSAATAPSTQPESASPVMKRGSTSSSLADSSASPGKAPVRDEGGRSGALIIREGRVTSTPSTAASQNVPQPSRESSATPWVNNRPSTATATPTPRTSGQSWQNAVREKPTIINEAPARVENSVSAPVARGQVNAAPAPTRVEPSAPARQPSQPVIIGKPAPPRVQSNPWGTTRGSSVNSSPWTENSRPGRSTPAYTPSAPSAPTRSAPTIPQAVRTPTPTPRFERYSPPQAPAPTPSPVIRESRPAPAPAMRSAPPPSQPAAPVQRSTPAYRGNSSGGDSGPARPGRK